MKTSGNAILITGGATGIGFALAEAFLRAGNKVVICGRGEDKLREAKGKLPGLNAHVCDVAKKEDRARLFGAMREQFPDLNVLVNNAGVQKQEDLRKGLADLAEGEDEIGTNLRAPIHLSGLFIPHLMKQKEAAIINVSSGLAFVPMAIFPVYCATKAALHSFSLSLRHQLASTSIKVIEIIPPRVDTELGIKAGERVADGNRGISPEEVATAALKGIAEDEFEIAVGMAQWLKKGSMTDPEATFRQLNQ